MDVIIDYIDVFAKLKIVKQGKNKVIHYKGPVGFSQIIAKAFSKELKAKKFQLLLKRDKIEEVIRESISFSDLVRKINHFKAKFNLTKVIEPNNIQSINIDTQEIILKEVKDFPKKIVNTMINYFVWAKEYKGHQKAMKLIKETLLAQKTIHEDCEFYGKVLLIGENSSKPEKAIYFDYKEEKIKILDNPEELYIKHHINEIKDHVKELNKNLKIQGKKPLEIEFNKNDK